MGVLAQTLMQHFHEEWAPLAHTWEKIVVFNNLLNGKGSCASGRVRHVGVGVHQRATARNDGIGNLR